MNPRKIFAITIALTKSQLRATRTSFASFGLLRRPISLLVIDAILFLAAAAVGYLIVSFASIASPTYYGLATTYVEEALVFVPAVIPGAVLVAGILFELNISSKFSASDTVNWLPVEQSDYVLASALSVSYDYSATLAAALGITVIPAFALGLWAAWTAMAILGLISLFMGGVLVEIVRAAVNRVSSAVMGRARKGAVFLRLVLTVGIVVAFYVVFNPSILLERLPNLTSGPSYYAVIPLFWSSFAVEGIIRGQFIYVLGFTGLTLGLAGALVWIAVHVRSRYWSPTPTMVRITSSEYAPSSSFLSRFGLTGGEVAIIRKDAKGATRRRELLTFLSVPIVLAVVFSLDIFLIPGSSGPGKDLGIFADLPVLFVGGLFGVMISSISFGQESKAVMVLYSLPIAPREILKAKAFFALSLALIATVATGLFFGTISGASLLDVLENILIGGTIAVEEVCVGLAFGASFPDFQERPRPRFVDPFWQLVMILVVALPLLAVTAIPILVRDVAVTVPGFSFPVEYLFPAALVFAGAISVLFYRWAGRSVDRLMAEYKI